MQNPKNWFVKWNVKLICGLLCNFCGFFYKFACLTDLNIFKHLIRCFWCSYSSIRLLEYIYLPRGERTSCTPVLAILPLYDNALGWFHYYWLHYKAWFDANEQWQLIWLISRYIAIQFSSTLILISHKAAFDNIFCSVYIATLSFK